MSGRLAGRVAYITRPYLITGLNLMLIWLWISKSESTENLRNLWISDEICKICGNPHLRPRHQQGNVGIITKHHLPRKVTPYSRKTHSIYFMLMHCYNTWYLTRHYILIFYHNFTSFCDLVLRILQQLQWISSVHNT